MRASRCLLMVWRTGLSKTRRAFQPASEADELASVNSGRKKTGPKAGFFAACRLLGGSGSRSGCVSGCFSGCGCVSRSGSNFFNRSGGSRSFHRGHFGFRSGSRFFFLAASGKGESQQSGEQDGIFHLCIPLDDDQHVDCRRFSRVVITPTDSILAKFSDFASRLLRATVRLIFGSRHHAAGRPSFRSIPAGLPWPVACPVQRPTGRRN